MDEIKSVTLGIYTPEEIKKISALNITESDVHDKYGLPNEGSLNDTKLGPEHGMCKTCGKGNLTCGGHLGRIELSVPILQRITIKDLINLLNMSCPYCNRLSINEIQKEVLINTFRLLKFGLVTEAQKYFGSFRGKFLELFGIKTIQSRKNRSKYSKNIGNEKKQAMDKKANDLKKERKNNEDEDDDEEDSESDEDLDYDDDEEDSEEELDEDESEDEDDEDEEMKNQEKKFTEKKENEMKKKSFNKTELKPQKQLKEKIKIQLREQKKKLDSYVNELLKGVVIRSSTPNLTIDEYEKTIDNYSNNDQVVYDEVLALREEIFKTIKKNKNCLYCNCQIPTVKLNETTLQFFFKCERIFSEIKEKKMKHFQLNKKVLFSEMKEKDPKEKNKRRWFVNQKEEFVYNTLPHELYTFSQEIFKFDYSILKYLFGRGDFNFNNFFITVLPVSSNKFRSTIVAGGEVFLHPMTALYQNILRRNQEFEKLLKEDPSLVPQKITELTEEIWKLIKPLNPNENSFTRTFPGIHAVLDKKQGLFRKFMMGKRVNYSGRSVILPDPLIRTDEVLIPETFAANLSFPENVTTYNIEKLRKLILNRKYPSASKVLYYNDEGLPIEVKLNRDSTGYKERKFISEMIKPPGMNNRVCIVHRDLHDGDIVLMNRQPTLHKLSILAHKVKVISSQKTVRFHYANCKSYNADFDGDEMNFHVPQCHLSRSEAYDLMGCENHYIVPTSGEPIRGLIQDYIVSAVLLTKKDTFLTKSEYQLLVYEALCNRKDQDKSIEIEPPAIYKPKKLWTGKQVISTILKNIINDNKFAQEKGMSGFNLTSKTKIKPNLWKGHEEECYVVIKNGNLLTGCLDKSQIGSSNYGLVHTCFEIYDKVVANDILSSFSRVFSVHLQTHGFTCGIDDCLVSEEADNRRKKNLKEADFEARKKNCEFSNTEFSVDEKDQKIFVDEEDYIQNMSKKLMNFSDEKNKDQRKRDLDQSIKKVINGYTSKIIKDTLIGQVKKFPMNFLQLMTETGAKGSAVNASQISVCLGLQELDGKRIPFSSANRTFSSYSVYDRSAMAGGFVGGRFLTGLKPQEYFVHCMAGRDGLIDTAVKTAKSGYLQRSVMKTLEGCSVQYDQTVRDELGRVIQFNYGGDSINQTQSSMLKNLDLISKNFDNYYKKLGIKNIAENFGIKKNNENDFYSSSSPEVEKYLKKVKENGGFNNTNNKIEPITNHYNPTQHLGVVSEKVSEDVEKFLAEKKDELLELGVDEEKFKLAINVKYLKSMVEPGDGVGVIAAQSIGEPSTQMTLNTFHFSGMDMAHVTVGIPRLTELLMTGTVKSHIITIPEKVKKENDEEEDEVLKKEKHQQLLRLTSMMTQINAFDFLESFEIEESYADNLSYTRCNNFEISLKFDVDNFDHFNLPPQYFKVVVNNLLPSAIEQVLVGLKRGSASSLNHKRIFEMILNRFIKGSSINMDISAYTKFSDESFFDSNYKEENITKMDIDDNNNNYNEINSDQEGDEDETPSDSEERRRRVNQRKKELRKRKKVSKKRINTQKDDNNEDSSEMRTVLLDKIPELKEYKVYKIDKTGCMKIFFSFYGQSPFPIAEVIKNSLKSLFLVYSKNISEGKVLTDEKGNYVINIIGSDIYSLWEKSIYENFQKIIDLNNIRQNSIKQFVSVYGIEAGRKLLCEEISTVFRLYGIVVDERHIGLIGDYLTSRGVVDSCNRNSVRKLISPFHKITFETATQNLCTSAVNGEKDFLKGPSSRIIFGQTFDQGTGIVNLRYE